MTRITKRDFVRVLCCLHLPGDETTEVNTTERQKDNDWTKPVSVARVTHGLDPAPESRPVRSKLAGAIACGSTAITGRFPSPGVAAPAGPLPRPSNNNQVDASTQTYFDDCLGQNGSQTSRHRTSIPSILRVGRAVLSGSGAHKRGIAQCSQVMEEQPVAGQVDLQESQRGGVGERQGGPMGLQYPRENAVGKGKEVAHQYIAYR
ncbi:hypothetical protein VE03_07584 [Pseudogymnoascus sp. 23342-1-I1]|nr:hypothetical protein VE03_07584 [Pseudogymnoascus sp. 23342-1-I1]